jgi:hypothetical protein
MKNVSSRRNFLATGLVLPATALASASRAGFLTDRAPGLPAEILPGLKFRVLGKTGLKVTSVGFGCMITSDPSVIEKAADLGINYFDTARVYSQGNNERMVGGALKTKRGSIVLSSKSGAEKKQEAMANLEKSLSELGTDHLDIWYLHGKNKASQITDEWLEAQAQAKKEGKIRFSGVSTHDSQPDIIRAVIAKKDQIDVVLTTYNFTMGAPMQDAIAEADKAGVGVVAMKVMAGGFRRNKPGEKVTETLKRPGAMLAALKWVLKTPGIHTTIPSITDMDQLDENMKAMTASFTPEDEKVLAAQLDYIRPLYCRMCGECKGACPKGLPVADMLRHLSYADGYGEFFLARESFLELPHDVRQIRCNHCSSCAVVCPNGVRVSERLARAQELFA